MRAHRALLPLCACRTASVPAGIADTSIPAVYELFGDKAGLIREVYFEGFRHLRRRLDQLQDSANSREDLIRVIEVFREFVRDNPMLPR